MEQKVARPTVKTVLWNLLKVVLLAFGLLWAVINTASIFFPYKQVVDVANVYVQQGSELSSVANTTADTPLDALFRASFKPFFILSTISVILGIAVLYNGRTILEMVYLFDGFFIPRQRHYWAEVFDLKNHTPISLATISLLQTKDGKESVVSHTVSDFDGHYRIRVPDAKGDYIMEVKAAGYEVFRKNVSGDVKGIINHGEILEDIPLSSTNVADNSFRATFYRLRPKLYFYLMAYLYVLSILGLVLYTYSAIHKPAIDNVGGALFFVAAVIWNTLIVTERRRNKSGRIIDQSSQPLAGAMVKIFQDGKQVNSLVTDQDGVVKSGLPAGTYEMQIDKAGYKTTDKTNVKNGLIQVRVNNDGYLTRNIMMAKGEGSTSQPTASTSTLQSPFQN